MITSLKTDFELDPEDDVSAFLGIQLDQDDEKKTISMTQHGLIDRILEATNMKD